MFSLARSMTFALLAAMLVAIVAVVTSSSNHPASPSPTQITALVARIRGANGSLKVPITDDGKEYAVWTMHGNQLQVDKYYDDLDANHISALTITCDVTNSEPRDFRLRHKGLSMVKMTWTPRPFLTEVDRALARPEPGRPNKTEKVTMLPAPFLPVTVVMDTPTEKVFRLYLKAAGKDVDLHFFTLRSDSTYGQLQYEYEVRAQVPMPPEWLKEFVAIHKLDFSVTTSMHGSDGKWYSTAIMVDGRVVESPGGEDGYGPVFPATLWFAGVSTK